MGAGNFVEVGRLCVELGHAGYVTAQEMKKQQLASQEDGYTTKLEAGILHGAAKNGSSQLLERLLNSTDSDANQEDSHGRTPMHYAALSGYIACMDILFKNGGYVDVLDADRCTPLHLAASTGAKAALKRLTVCCES